ncbi:MAG: 4Fe-4S single cluster domain-containing protein [Clostridia bacterium]
MSDSTPDSIRLYGLVTDSIVDGPGFRVSIFTQGCPHRCEGCHNPESHDPNGGKAWTLDAVEAAFTGNPLLEGITLSGGEPFSQPAACAELARRAHARGLTVWTFSGHLYEALLAMAEGNEAVRALLDETDVLVDGPFMLKERSLELLYCGSKNQRLIDLKKTREAGEVVRYAPSEWC